MRHRAVRWIPLNREHQNPKPNPLTGSRLTKPPSTAVTKRAARRRVRNRLQYGEAMKLAQELDVTIDANYRSIADVLDQIFARVYALWQMAATEADEVPVDEFWVTRYDAQDNRIVEPNKWAQVESALREELFEMGSRLQGLNIDERRVRIEEAQLQLLASALKSAAKAAGLTDEQQRVLGSHLRRELQPNTIEGQPTAEAAEEITAQEDAA